MPLRVLISSTPKTGNTWLFNLLASLYNLDRVGLLVPFDRKQAHELGDRWVAFHHMRPTPELLDWIAADSPILLTTVRHPGDVLISLYHHVHAFEKDGEDPGVMRGMLHSPFDRNLIEPLERTTFAGELSLSLEWLRAGARMVRYEDIWRDPVAALNELAAILGPVSQERVERAVERCDFDLMRKLAGKHGGFFRSGKVGEWRSALSAEIIADFAEEPYRSQFAELGYTLDAADPAIAAPAKPRPRLNPFRDFPRFQNGVPVAPIIVDCYLSMDSEVTQAWGDPTRTGPGSFYEWLNAPSGLEGEGIYTELPLSNLARFVYSSRTDLRDSFPRITKPDRPAFLGWFTTNGTGELELDAAFIEQSRRELPVWVNTIRGDGTSWPRLNNIALHMHATHPSLRESYPDLAGSDSARYAEWFVRNGESELGLDASLIDAVRTGLVAWGTRRPPASPENRLWLPLTNFEMHIYRSNPDAQAEYPDVIGINRWRFLDWMLEKETDLNLYDGFAVPLRREMESRRGTRTPAPMCEIVADIYCSCTPEFHEHFGSFLEWLGAPIELDGREMYSGLRISNLAYYIYRSRTDLMDAFPDLTGCDRADYAEWFVRNGEVEFGLDAPLIEPVRASLLEWGNSRSPRDLIKRPWWPRLTNFALHLYDSRADVQLAYPAVLDADRWNFLQWTVDHAADLNLYPPLSEPIRQNLTRLRLLRNLLRKPAFRKPKTGDGLAF